MQESLIKIFAEADPSLDEKSLQFLARILVKNDQSGFDYLEFKQSLKALKAMNMDEVTAMKSAYTTATTMGLTKDKLLASALHYQKLLSIEREHFNEELKRQLDKKVGGQIEEADSLKQTLTEIEAQIADLQNKAIQAKKTLGELESSISQEKGKLEETKAAFESTLEGLVRLIDVDIKQIDKHI